MYFKKDKSKRCLTLIYLIRFWSILNFKKIISFLIQAQFFMQKELCLFHKNPKVLNCFNRVFNPILIKSNYTKALQNHIFKKKNKS